MKLDCANVCKSNITDNMPLYLPHPLQYQICQEDSRKTCSARVNVLYCNYCHCLPIIFKRARLLQLLQCTTKEFSLHPGAVLHPGAWSSGLGRGLDLD